ncbi:MAG: hydroxyacid dehydrogenase [Candidatus Methanomethyliaceae archaeon]|nr:hydroxyacid dehydrogenase [Candidatus Methanomethyliaceae archaeon]MDW7970705.1 hydroxyacid dehydrogenase [Nitrososphaerota archaeon]
MKILIADEVHEECSEKLKKAGFEVEEKPNITNEDLKKIINNYDILIVRGRIKVTRDIIENATNLKLIGRVGVGLDNIDVEAAERRGIKVINTPQMSTIAVAELTISLILNLLRGTYRAIESMKKGLWEKKSFYGNELFNKTLGIIGFGRIGKAVAERAKAFGMKVIVYDIFMDQESLERMKVTRASSLEELLRLSDIISLHVPLTKDTKHLINSSTIALMRTGAYIINTSRGEIINTKDLLEALKSGKLAGAALDVFENEPPKEPWEKELIQLPNVITTPHIGAQTYEAQAEGAKIMAENIIKLFGR